MGQPIPAQHPSVVLRSHFNRLKALLAVALAAVIALGAAVVIVANDDDQLSGGTTAAKPIESINYSGFNPATGSPDTVQRQSLPPGTRFDGGPDEGTRGPRSYYESPNARSSYQPAPADGTKARAGGPTMLPQGPGAR